MDKKESLQSLVLVKQYSISFYKKSTHLVKEIHERILDLEFQDCRVLVSNVDSQASLSGGIIVQVLGEMSNKGSASHKFAQTFFLAEQPNGYYVLNDIFRFLKEDIDNNEYDETFAAHVDATVPTPANVVAVEASAPAMNKHISSNTTVVNGSVNGSAHTGLISATPSAGVVTSTTTHTTTSARQHEWIEPTTEATTWVEPSAPAPTTQPSAKPKVVEKEVASLNENSKPKTWAIAAGTTPLVGVSNGKPQVQSTTSKSSSPAKKEVLAESPTTEKETPPVTASTSQASHANSTNATKKEGETPVVGYSRKHENRKSVDSAEAAGKSCSLKNIM